MKKIDDYTIGETNKKGGKVTTITRTLYSQVESPDQQQRRVECSGAKINNVAVFVRFVS
jgi:hypothetical protein